MYTVDPPASVQLFCLDTLVQLLLIIDTQHKSDQSIFNSPVDNQLILNQFVKRLSGLTLAVDILHHAWNYLSLRLLRISKGTEQHFLHVL